MPIELGQIPPAFLRITTEGNSWHGNSVPAGAFGFAMLSNVVRLICLLSCTSVECEQRCEQLLESGQAVRSDLPLRRNFARENPPSILKRRRRQRSSRVASLYKLVGYRLYSGEFLTPQFLGSIEAVQFRLGFPAPRSVLSCRGPPEDYAV